MKTQLPSAALCYHAAGCQLAATGPTNCTVWSCDRMVVSFDPYSLECIGIVVRGVRGAVVVCCHQWREERKRQSGAYADRLPDTLFSLTTILKHSRQVWNHYSDTLPHGISALNDSMLLQRRVMQIFRTSPIGGHNAGMVGLKEFL